MSSDVLVTGFEAFPGVDKNPSALVAMVLGDRYDSAVLPVNRAAGDIVGQILKKYRIILHFGVNTHIKRLELERVALNLYDSDKPDNDDHMADEEPIVEGGPAAYLATMPVKRLAERMSTVGVPCAVSNTAGTYICNLVFYKSLHHAALTNSGAKICFVHIPMMPEEILLDWCGRLVEEAQKGV